MNNVTLIFTIKEMMEIFLREIGSTNIKGSYSLLDIHKKLVFFSSPTTKKLNPCTTKKKQGKNEPLRNQGGGGGALVVFVCFPLKKKNILGRLFLSLMSKGRP